VGLTEHSSNLQTVATIMPVWTIYNYVLIIKRNMCAKHLDVCTWIPTMLLTMSQISMTTCSLTYLTVKILNNQLSKVLRQVLKYLHI